MYSYQIISDSSCDLPEELLKEYNIAFVPYYVSFDGTTYYKELIDIGPKAFYKKMIAESAYPKTSLPSIQDYIDVFQPFLKKGLDVICFCLTAKFSGSFQSATNAKNILQENYPGQRIVVIDSIQATGGQGLLVQEAVRMQRAGYSLDTLLEKIELIKPTARINFTLDSLEHLEKGGRIGKVGAFLGAILNIKPILVMEQGELAPHSKVRGHKKALKAIIEKTAMEIGEDKDAYEICLINAARDEDVAYVKEVLEGEYGFQMMEPVLDVGVTIGTHAGPTAVGICYLKKYEFV